MITMKVPFSPPDITQAEIDEVVQALRSGWITTGPRTKQFEKNIADYVGTKMACCLNSQTACAELALRLLGVGEGDEVITTAYTYTASASVVCHVGAKLVLVDTQKNSLEMDYDALENAVNERTKVIIPVDVAGIPCDYDKVFDIVERKKSLFRPSNVIQKAIGRVSVNADTAHSLGASRKGVKTGAIGDFSAFSFHAVKNFTTAEGGASTWCLPAKSYEGTNKVTDEEIYHMYQLSSLHGQSKDALAKTKIGAWEYDIVGPWYKCNMTDIMAAIGLRQLDRYLELLERRIAILKKYDAVCDELGIFHLVHHTDFMDSSNHLYLIRIPGITAEQRNEIIEKIAEHGVATNVHYKPLPMMTAYKALGWDIKDFPNTYDYYHNLITLPLHTLLSDEDVDYVCETVKNVIHNYI